MPPNRRELQSLKNRIVAIRSKTKGFDPGDEILAELAGHLCVLASGLIESYIRNAVQLLVSQTKPNARVGNAATAFASTIHNPFYDRIHKFLKDIDAGLARRLDSSADENLKSAINSIVANRNLIAHGRTSSLSIRRVEEYIDRLKPLFDVLDRLSRP